MNKRINIFYITTVAVAIMCLILDLIFTDNTFSFLGICFALTMLVYGLCLIIRGLRFKIDSSLFLGNIILTFGIISILTTFTSYGYLDLWHYLFLGASVSSIMTGIYFKLIRFKKLTVLFLGLYILSQLSQIGIYAWWIMLIVMAIWAMGYMLVNNMIISRRK